jgi:hypothetical protein
MARSGPPIALGVVCCVVGPVLGLLAASLADNPPGNGPGGMQVVLGGGVPAVISFTAARLAGARPVFATLWALASLVATGFLLFALFLFVEVVIQPA